MLQHVRDTITNQAERKKNLKFSNTERKYLKNMIESILKMSVLHSLVSLASKPSRNAFPPRSYIQHSPPALLPPVVLLLIHADHGLHHPSFGRAGGGGHPVAVQSGGALCRGKQCVSVRANQALHLALSTPGRHRTQDCLVGKERQSPISTQQPVHSSMPKPLGTESNMKYMAISVQELGVI